MEKKEIKSIGILTSGGDAPGMNAAIRAVVRSAIFNGLRVFGIERGYTGLLNENIYEMNIRSVSSILQRGGTMLYTSRCPEFMKPEGVKKGAEVCRKYNLDALVCIGGDGTYRGARDLSKYGIGIIGLPGTIDNDIACTDYTIGYDTAMNTAMEAIDKLRDTTQSHDRCSVVQVMGHKAGYLALNTGLACGAMAILVPEIPFDLQKDVIDRMHRTQLTGKRHFIVLNAEGCGNALDIAAYIQERFPDIETRATILGYVQRGGSPSVRDRITATKMGVHAVDLLSQGITGRIVAERDGKITDVDIDEALAMKKTFDRETYDMALKISI
ncbi:MAG: ATP-dependent 6-phosphofructokinase [Oscillospiraceae bacterium]|jgi:6-phosphofructokinase 1